MKFTTAIVASLAASMVAASPVPEPEAAAQKTQAQALIDLWQDKGFLGLKFTGSANVGDCKNLPNNFSNNVSSGKAKPGFRCTTWVDRDCKGTGFSFNTSPGASSFPSWIDNKSSSWKCVQA